VDNQWISNVEMLINFEGLSHIQIVYEFIHEVLHNARVQSSEFRVQRIFNFMHIYTKTTRTRD